VAALTKLLNTARDALNAQSFGLNVTGQNISNVNTPGYVRREAVLQTRALGTQTTGSVETLGIRRASDAFLDRRQYETTGQSSAASQHNDYLSSLEALFNDQSGTGLSSAVSGLFSSFSALSANPGDPNTRASVLSAADGFSSRVNQTADAMASQRTELLQQAQATAQAVNERSDQIAKLNMRIASATAQGEDAADLRDQRNRVLLDMASFVDIQTIDDGAGNVVVQGAGTTLVDGQHTRPMSVDLASDGSLRILVDHPGGSADDATRFLTGGKLAAIRETRDVDIFAAQQKLDSFVFDVTNAVNAQHRAGVGKDGVAGRNLFDVSGTAPGAARSVKLSVDVAGQPDRIAAASSVLTLPGGSDNAVALSTLADKALATGGTRTASQAYGDIVGSIGSTKASAERSVETQQAIHDQIHAMHEAMSGVSLDEEMVNLTKFQRAYEAASKVLSTVDQLLAELIAHVGT
jgi:flagellar hook-associated protein 1 FlgK